MSVFDDGPVLMDGPVTMMAVLQELAGSDALTYRGSVEVWGDASVDPPAARWRLHVNDDKGEQLKSRVDLQSGVIEGEYLARVYGRLLVLNADEAGA